MKKLMLFIAIIIATGTISVYANGEKVHLQIVFEAVDAQGNRDTAEFAIRDRATNGLDPELGEVNLYGVPPQGDLDIRLVQRQAINENKSWLSAGYPFATISFPNNMDLKKDYRSNVDLLWYEDSRLFAVKVFAKYYPISVNILNISNHNSIDDIRNNSEIAIITFDETITDRVFNSVIDINDSNSCGYRHLTNKIDTVITYINNDTIYNFIAEPELIGYGNSGRVFTFLDSASRNYVLGGKYVPAGLGGDVKEVNNSIKLYPNPSNNNVIISEGNAGDTFEIVNSAGDKISNFAVEVFPFSYDVSALSAGVYYIINTTSGNGFGKFVKE